MAATGTTPPPAVDSGGAFDGETVAQPVATGSRFYHPRRRVYVVLPIAELSRASISLSPFGCGPPVAV